jgi:hypothetical protein
MNKANSGRPSDDSVHVYTYDDDDEIELELPGKARRRSRHGGASPESIHGYRALPHYLCMLLFPYSIYMLREMMCM